ncbi:MAG TPA: neutral zinc metallopeptidase [Thermomicrobiales bacterium]|nr:neutral zinc metallopeptidase [Thermomicrobiales bacterium]
MMKHVRATLMLVLVIWMTAANAGLVAAQQVTDEKGITRTVTDLLKAEGDGNADHMYDLLAPDEREMIPRQAFAIWLAAGPTTPTGAPEIGEISTGTWISSITGDRYDVVFVAYTVDVASEQGASTRSDEFVLGNDGGSWRWFFDGGRQDVAAVTDATAWSVDYESPYRTEMFRNLDLFWAQVFAAHGLDYHPPVDMIGVNVEPIETGCGIEDNIVEMAVYYCTIDETIYYDPDFRDLLVNQIGEYAWQHVIGHEWGHHIQNLLGISTSRDPELLGGQYTIEHELQADCLSGIFDQDAYARGVIDSRDLQMAATITGLAGDSTGTSWDDSSAHGSSDQRQQSYQLGFTDGFIGCHVSLDAAG